MTKIELFTAIANRAEITDEMVELAQHMIELDAASKERAKAKRASRPESETAVQNRVAATTLLEEMGDATMTAADIAEKLGVSSSKASAIARAGVAAGLFIVSEVKGPKGKVKGYSAAITYDAAADE